MTWQKAVIFNDNFFAFLQFFLLTLFPVKAFYATVFFQYPLKTLETRGFMMLWGGIDRDQLN